jgi:transcriptional regulator with XRE-family HTH domain
MGRMPEKWHQLITLRKAAGLSQYDLARQLKISRSALGNYEMGEREPDFDTTKKMAGYFGVTVDHLVGREDAGEPAADLSAEWKHAVEVARTEGFTPDRVIQAIRLLHTMRRQQEQAEKEEREG